MRILELLLPKNANAKDKDISPKHTQRIDLLQKRMDKYVDKIGDPSTSTKGREFLKAKLKDDYDELRGVIKDAIEESTKQRIDKSCWSGYHKAGTKTKGGVKVNNCVKNESTELPPVEPVQPVQTYEVVDSRTGKVVGKPYNSRSRASGRADKLDNEYGGYRFKVRRVGGPLSEANPNQQISRYNPSGTTYRGEPMPTLDADPVDDAESLGSTHDKPYELDTDSIDRRQLVSKYLSILPARYQSILRLRFFDGMTLAEIGDKLNISGDRVRQLEANALRKIKNHVAALDAGTGKEYSMGQALREAVHKLPLTEEDFELVRTLMSRPIPAVIAPIYIQEIINDDEFNDMLNEFAEMNPGMDVRPHVVEWMKRVMPDQMYRFNDSAQSEKQKLGQTSVIHGYDPHMYHGSNEPITGDAYGRK